MRTRLSKTPADRKTESVKLGQAQFPLGSLRDSAQRTHTQEIRQLPEGQSLGHNFGQIEIQPTAPKIIQPRPIIGHTLERTERGGNHLAGEPVIQGTKVPLQLTSISKQRISKQPHPENLPTEARQQTSDKNLLLGDGNVSFSVISQYCKEAHVDDVKRLDPKSDLVRNILKTPLKQSWHLAKEELALSNLEVRRALMQKLLEFRQWHHQFILELTRQEINERYGNNALLPSKGGGSDTLTSDIDVNLKGTHTEEAVKVFNRLFKEDGWKYESGVVYDVNVYAVDFMHQFGGEIVREAVGLPEQSVTVKEGARGIFSQGGFADRNSEVAKADRQEQEEWALVKLRLYMTVQQWDNYCKQSKLSPKTVKGVESKYSDYLKTIGNRMYKINHLKGASIKQKHLNESGINAINDTADIVTKVKSTIDRRDGDNHEELQDVRSEELKMRASNRLYENKLGEVGNLRQQSEYNNLLGLANLPFFEEESNTELEKKIKVIRSRVSEAALYANEAYVTDAAVYHAVVGLQGGKQIQQTKAELMNVVTENLADALKEIARHGSSLGEAAYKAGKYYMRMTDAAKNMELGGVPGVQPLYNAGYEISVRYKNESRLTEEEKQQKSSEYITNRLHINSVDALKNMIIEVATEIRKKFTLQGEEEKQKLGKAGPKKNEENKN